MRESGWEVEWRNCSCRIQVKKRREERKERRKKERVGGRKEKS